jgi:hypothetical protein
MEVRIEHKTTAKCRPEGIWEIFRNVEEWRNWSNTFGQSGWVHGAPWQPGSRFFIEVIAPRRIDLEVVVLRCSPPDKVVLLCHGEGLAGELWIQFASVDWDRSELSIEAAVVGATKLSKAELNQVVGHIFDGWFENLRLEVEKYCLAVSL